jgi:hypothetical protein
MVHLSGCVGLSASQKSRLERMTDLELWQHSLVLRGKAQEELRCEGLSLQARRASLDRRFGARAVRVREALLAKHGTIDDAVIPVGYRCPSTEGGREEYERVLLRLERRLFP